MVKERIIQAGCISQQQKGRMMNEFVLDGENVLTDDYPVFWNYIYLCDQKPIRSDVKGSVLDLKRDLQSLGYEAKEIRNCDIFARQKLIDNRKAER